MITWTTKTGHDKRIRQFHPWVFSNELDKSPKGIAPGTPVVLKDSNGIVLAKGYGNPNSLISFRALSFGDLEQNPWGGDFIRQKLLDAWKTRNALGFEKSFRLCFGEGDHLPGLIIDRYLVDVETEKGTSRAQVFSLQILTAGMQVLMSNKTEILQAVAEEAMVQGISEVTWEKTAIVDRSDVQIRKLEGLDVPQPTQVKGLEGADLTKADILLEAFAGGAEIKMRCDLIDGQKTGFFLDQTQNIRQVINLLKSSRILKGKTKLRVLDLCCYVGHWSTQIARYAQTIGLPVEVTLVDVSETALAAAEINVTRENGAVNAIKGNVLEDLQKLPMSDFDLVIADPPAFIKAKKDIPTGRHAYLKFNTQAFRLVRPGGLVVSCSCSGLFQESEFIEVVEKAIRRNELEAIRLLRGESAGDHPHLVSFPEGAYLKMFTHYLP